MTEGGKQAPLIAVIEDDAELRRGLVRLFEQQGMRVASISGGLQALPTLIRERPDVVILDVMMPGIDGWEVLRRVRASEAIATVPVLMLTARTSIDDRVKGLSEGADDYLTKPFSVRELLARVAALLRRAELSEAEPVKIPVVGDDCRILLDAARIIHIEGLRNQVIIAAEDGEYVCRLGLGDVEKRLPERFVRVHRSHLVDLNRVRSLRWASKSSCVLALEGLDREIPVSRSHVADVRARLGLT